jgi:hypothetical protein
MLDQNWGGISANDFFGLVAAPLAFLPSERWPPFFCPPVPAVGHGGVAKHKPVNKRSSHCIC